MPEMLEIEIIKTSKGYAPSDEWTQYDKQIKQFDDKEQAMKWINEEYEGHKRKPIYLDFKGESKQVGFVIGFRNWEYNQDRSGDRYHFFEQHWIHFYDKQSVILN